LCSQREEQLPSRNVKRFRGGLVFKAHRLLYHSTLGLRVIKKKRSRREECGENHFCARSAAAAFANASCRCDLLVQCFGAQVLRGSILFMGFHYIRVPKMLSQGAGVGQRVSVDTFYSSLFPRGESFGAELSDCEEGRWHTQFPC